MKDEIRKFAINMGVDDIGFASVKDYHSPKSPSIESIFPGAKSLIVMAYQELDNCESENKQIAFSGRIDQMEFARSSNYKLARFLSREYKAKVMSVPVSYPLNQSKETMGAVGEVSLRHAAVAAGLGNFGLNNLVLHPQMGSRVIFTALITDVDFLSDPPVEERICIDCMACVKACPSGALNNAGKTDVLRCVKNSQPYGLSANIHFWSKFAASSVEVQQEMLKDTNYWWIYQAGYIGLQYFCFNCMKECPIGRK